jgi:putative nucleotidyltransferase with HDIG domain
VLPIPFILYITFRTAVARMQDDVAHLTRINSIYLSTIETLAQAVDARDQVTHDHIRRVQKNAMRLAREVGLNEDQQLRALEAAALLHDTGKLAIPEHILNKPDVLTPAEFEVMKRHAVIGADILSSIDFPFPVVPIVRHHHENWDGSGYPDGLRGNEIPMAARILSVVDCFDALTSDRPYRGALTPEKALAVILERSGVMYDPVVVDALLRIKDEISAESPGSSRLRPRA